jgi:transposase
MAEPVRARRLTDAEGQTLQRIVRRGRHNSVRVRRALIIMASASGTPVPAIARLVKAHEDTVRDVIHAFNQQGLDALDPRWAGGRPRQISPDDERFIVQAAKTRPEKLGRPFTHWSTRKLAGYLADNPVRVVAAGRERLRQLLRHHQISFQRTRTWKESRDPQREAKLDRIEQVTSSCLDRCFAFDQFGPLSVRPHHGSAWATQQHPLRLPATYRRTHGIRYFHGCYSLGGDQLWGVTRRRKGADHTLAALQSIRAARPDGERLYVIVDNLSANTTPPIRRWAKRNKVELCLTRTSASWANRSSRSSGRCAASCSAPPTTLTTPCWPASCRATCAGATPTPATPTCWPPSAASAPASAANASADGAAPHHKQHDHQPGERMWSAH